MDELMELRRLRADLPDPTDTVLAEARARIVEHDVRPAVLLRPARRPRRPLRRRVLVGIAASAAVATVAYALTAGDASRPSPTAPHYRNAAQFLDAASAAALKAGDQSVPAGQYRHVRERFDLPRFHGRQLGRWHSAAGPLWSSGRLDWYLPSESQAPAYLHQRSTAPASMPGATMPEWYRITTTKLGVTYASIPRGIVMSRDWSGCHGCIPADFSPWNIPTRASIATLPTDVEQLRASLYDWARAEIAHGEKEHQTFSDLALTAIGGVLANFPDSADLRSALFQVAKQIPGIELHGSMKNEDGVPGVGVGVGDRFHVEQNLIFSADGRTFLGTKDIVRQRSRVYDVPAGTVISSTAVAVLGNTGKPKLPAASKTRR